ncbi:POMT1 (predicted) [Pycnogonum litorale]
MEEKSRGDGKKKRKENGLKCKNGTSSKDFLQSSPGNEVVDNDDHDQRDLDQSLKNNGFAHHETDTDRLVQDHSVIASKENSHGENSNMSSSSMMRIFDKPFTVNFKLDVMSMLLFTVGMATRMWRLQEPMSIVFDELHYGKFASLYMKNTFFFDSHPPLGKQLIALAGYLAGFDADFQFDRIGGVYNKNIPVWALRAVPAFFGSLLVPTVYHIIVEMGLTHWTAAITAFLIIFDNALLTQSRFILMESMLIFFSAFGVFCLIKFRKIQNDSFSPRWWFWLMMMSLSLTCGVCVKYIGILSSLLACVLLTKDFWFMIADKTKTNIQLLIELVARIFVMVALPIFLYLLCFYVHLTILIKAGPHDNVMTSAFQASLEGGLASVTKGQPLVIAHGSQITLRHTHGRACWLHSHPHVYPLRYPDKRGSSHQQQVSCYSFKDVNNWWIVKRPDRNDLVVSEPLDPIKHGDVVQLVHGITSRALNSHDVAAPMSPQNQEVSCYIDYNISFPAQNLWKVDIINKDSEGLVWHTIQSQVRLIHVNSTQALKFSGKQLPDWGFHQHEVATDRIINQDDTIWNVEEHRYTKGSDQKERERELGMAEFVPTKPTTFTFFEKLCELQYKMLTANQENVQEHMYSSDPLDWPLMTRGIAYWVSQTSNAQIHLLGNLLIWYWSTFSIFIYLTFLAIYMLRRRRACYDIPNDEWSKFVVIGEVFLLSYAMHFVPFFFSDGTLFLHHYLPAFIYQVLLAAALLEHITFLISHILPNQRVVMVAWKMLVVVWLISIFIVYKKFSVLSYGTTELSAIDVLNLRWKDSWDLIIHRH